MAVNDKEQLKIKVEEFVRSQSVHDDTKKIRVVCDEGDLYFILYGEDLAVGIGGFGETADGAYNDFIDNWESFYAHKKRPLRET